MNIRPAIRAQIVRACGGVCGNCGGRGHRLAWQNGQEHAVATGWAHDCSMLLCDWCSPPWGWSAELPKRITEWRPW